MLEAALGDESESVFVELTYADLQALKSRKAGADGACAALPVPTKDKRYVILTYASQYDRVHYPLPLSPEGLSERSSCSASSRGCSARTPSSGAASK